MIVSDEEQRDSAINILKLFLRTLFLSLQSLPSVLCHPRQTDCAFFSSHNQAHSCYTQGNFPNVAIPRIKKVLYLPGSRAQLSTTLPWSTVPWTPGRTTVHLSLLRHKAFHYYSIIYRSYTFVLLLYLESLSRYNK